MNNLTANRNLLPTANFKLIINSTEFANTEFFAVTANIPSVSVGEATAGWRNQAGFVSGEKLNYEPFNIRMVIDEDLVAYREIYNWIKHNTSENDLKISDITLMLLSSHNNPNTWFRFVNAFPTSLGSIDFNSQIQDVEYNGIDVTFRYDYFVITSASDNNSCA